MTETLKSRWCVLAYNPADRSTTVQNAAPVALFALEPQSGHLSVCVHPEWERIVRSVDHDYIRSLLTDWAERSLTDPLALFAQVSSLGVGPLITREVGTSIEDLPQQRRLFEESTLLGIAALRAPASALVHSAAHSIDMQEILSKTDSLKDTLHGQEFYELRLDDSADIWRPGFMVVQTRAC